MASRNVEPVINIQSREQLLYLLAEAAEIEHNLLCCYLFAAFSLKRELSEGLSADEFEAVERWRREVMSVAVEEMTHLSLVANLTTALGGVAHFSRPNFPVEAGRYPSGVIVRLTPFDRGTLQHFLHLERPEGYDVTDGAEFATTSVYVRETVIGKCMPSAQDYLTVGHLYRALREGVLGMVERLGESGTFIGDPAAQTGAEVVNLPGLSAVTDLQSALTAIDTVVHQGEGASIGGSDSHYGRFLAIAQEYDALLARNAAFVPHRRVACNPVMRRPPEPRNKVFVEGPAAAKVLDVANAAYGVMLRCLAQAFGRLGRPDEKRILVDCAIDLMFAVARLAEFLTTLPASELHPGLTAGISFAMLRDVSRMQQGAAEWRLISERLDEVAKSTTKLSAMGGPIAEAASRLTALSERFGDQTARFASRSDETAVFASAAADARRRRHALEPQIKDGDIEVAQGKQLTLKFDAKRCIHARFCVLGLPQVYKTNVKGPWIDPDAAALEANIAVAHNCPSGAIRYERHDGRPEEGPPQVNVVRLRENGPYAFAAPLIIEGNFVGFRATLCRCGASKNKPFCDGAHNAIEFRATGEPETASFEQLALRDGPLELTPQHNGPLAVSGNLEILSGTGRAITRTTNARLCRCGHSGSKPYCDGTHSKVGFSA